MDGHFVRKGQADTHCHVVSDLEDEFTLRGFPFYAVASLPQIPSAEKGHRSWFEEGAERDSERVYGCPYLSG